MSTQEKSDLADYYANGESWAADRAAAETRARRIAWWIAGIASLIALCEAIALILLLPLKTVVPYTLLVDKQTGFVQELDPLKPQQIAPDAALARSFLVQYVTARESFDINALKANYRKVALWSEGTARNQYVSSQQASNPTSPLATLPRQTVIATEIRSISPINADTALVRFSTVRTDPGGQSQPAQTWAATIKYRFSNAAMSAEDRLTNPLGFQVLRYNRDAEFLPEIPPAPAVPSTQPVRRDQKPL
ncbi:MAG: type IV secretion system protein [Sphingomonadales bacterium]|nr:type IV secretion system protein [Sphingomonadales bacterium]